MSTATLFMGCRRVAFGKDRMYGWWGKHFVATVAWFPGRSNRFTSGMRKGLVYMRIGGVGFVVCGR